MTFYSLCFNAGFGGEIRIYDNFDEYIRAFADLIEFTYLIGLEAYKVSAINKEDAYKKARKHYNNNGWEIQ